MNPQQNRNEWLEVRSYSEVLKACGLSVDEVLCEMIDISGFASTSAISQHFTVQTVFPASRPGTLEFLIPYTKIWVDITALRSGVKEDLVWAGIAYAATQDVTTSAILSILRKVLGKGKLLSEDEVELITVIIGMAGGRPYSNPVSEVEIRKAYVDATVSVEDLLDSLTDKGVIVNRRGEKIKLRF